MKSANSFALRSCVLVLISSLGLVLIACDKFTLPRFLEDEPVQQHSRCRHIDFRASIS